MLGNGTFSISTSVSEVLTTPENRSGTIFDSVSKGYSFTNGVIPGKNDLVWSDRRTVAMGATDVIDLFGGGLLDALNNPVNFLFVTGIMLSNRETVAGTRILNFGPNMAANPFIWLFGTTSDLVSIVPSSAYIQWNDAGVTTAGGLDKIRIINTDIANPVTFDILITGRSV
jgi:hypothetical protein